MKTIELVAAIALPLTLAGCRQYDAEHFLDHYQSIVKELSSETYQGRGNIIANVSGRCHDSCYVFTAHYDHLGNLGANVYYPGANDNASGTAAIITLAEYYAHNNPVQYCELSDAGMAAWPLWEQTNTAVGSFDSLNRGELAANSDHYPFAVRGVPCVFFENEEGDAFKYYHTVDDTWDNFISSTYVPIFNLVTTFVEEY